MIGPEHVRNMSEARRRPPERLVEEQLPRRIRNVIFATNHMADLHEGVINHDGEVVRRNAAGAHEDEIADDIGHERHASANEIIEGDLAIAIGYAEPDHRGLA